MPKTIHGIYPGAPGWVEDLIALHRQTFGDAEMNAGSGAEDTEGANGADGTPGAPEAGAADELGEAGKRALQAERDAAAAARQELATVKAELKTLQDAALTEEQRREQRTKELEEGATTHAQELASKDVVIEKYRVAAAKGLDLNLAERLTGSTREDLEKDADNLKALLAPAKTSGTQFHRQQENDGGGNATGSSLQAGRDLHAARHKKSTTN